MTFFIILVLVVVLQRLAEIIYARRNEKKMKAKGAIEIGASHYKWIVLLHIFFFFSLIMEATERQFILSSGWQVFLLLFIVVQILRIWTLTSLGEFWNTKIIVLPGAKKVNKGPYRWISHPNYAIVMLEIILLPLIYGAWITALIFSAANAIILLFIRIPTEEKALEQLKKMTND
ncbi:isoprenylcysteine carboxyl methyltransferase family protein [Alteribacillus sp. YIM 98480]|uniref:isoprenylcysteine carboxyl methyltransferase family protein n=1 Tax=Alteribacillus sp. YIM 98480 TaxID=2606599 RepID=UPI00131D2252|nr:isoprenylcysteine carboxylmethyltransferase family protein [Alteribacillus sp. YIM 98480]